MSPTTKRLMKEAAELSPNSPTPSPHFHASPIDDSNLFEWHFTILGPPPPSSFANGIYHGRIVLPPTYPLRPPSFRFLTPSGRFEVNREICLSISGHHEESWQPAWGIRTALIAIRSFMDGEAKGQVGGLDVSAEVRKEWARKSRGWKCEVCGGGKTNEEVMSEWWEMCKGKGVSVEDGDEAVPKELRVGFKDEMEKKKREAQAQTQPSAASTATTTTVTESSSTLQTPAFTAPSQSSIPAPTAPPTETLTPTPTIPLPDSSPISAAPPSIDSVSPPPPQPRAAPVASIQPPSTSQQQSQSQTTASATNIASSTAMTPTTAPLAPRRQRPQPAQHAQSAWLDRAIVGVALALLVMIIQKFYP